MWSISEDWMEEVRAMKSGSLNAKRVVSRKKQSGKAEMAVDSPSGVELDQARPWPQSLLRGWLEAPRALTSSAPVSQLRVALEQIEILAGRNFQLKQQVVGLAREIEKAQAFAYHDQLTSLPNRRLLLDSFRQVSARARRERKRLALMFIDLDGFKLVNDQFGHSAGDAILKEVARRLKTCVRDGETACRFGGDEFVVLLEGCKGRHDAWVGAKRISAELSAPYVLGDAMIEITASIGMSIFPDDGRECGDLIEVADVSMLGQKRCRLGLPKVL